MEGKFSGSFLNLGDGVKVHGGFMKAVLCTFSRPWVRVWEAYSLDSCFHVSPIQRCCGLLGRVQLSER